MKCAVLSAVTALALAGCGARAPEAAKLEASPDPATVFALEAPLLSDPDLTSQSRQFQVLSDPGPVDRALPPDDPEPALRGP